MITRIDAILPSGEVISFPLTMTAKSYVIESVEGLDPVKASITTSDYAQIDGSTFQSARREPRTIQLKINILPNYAIDEDVRSLRRRLYQFFMPKNYMRLSFFDSDGTTYFIDGYVETFETSLFSAESMVDISVLCPDPNFVEDTTLTYVGKASKDVSGVTIYYPGTIPTGVIFRVNPTAYIGDITILMKSPLGDVDSFSYGYPTGPDSTIIINTNPGSKGITFFRGSDNYSQSVLYGVSPESKWPMLYPGDNFLLFYNATVDVPYTMEFNVKHGGL